MISGSVEDERVTDSNNDKQQKNKNNGSFSHSSTILTVTTSIDLMQAKLDGLVKNFDD